MSVRCNKLTFPHPLTADRCVFRAHFEFYTLALHMAQFPPTTTPRAAGDGTIVTMASDSPFAQPESTAGDLFPVGAHMAHSSGAATEWSSPACR